MSEEVEKAVLNYALAYPAHGPLRVAQSLCLEGIQVSSGGVRGVWQRHNLLTKHERLLRLEEHVGKQAIRLTDEQVRLLERLSPEFREGLHRTLLDEHFRIKGHHPTATGLMTTRSDSLKGVPACHQITPRGFQL